MLTRFAKILLFFSAYLPLFAILTINYIRHGWWVVIPLGLSVLALLGILLLVRLVGATNPRPLQVQRVRRQDAEIMAYIITYVFPFLGLEFDNLTQILSLSVFFLVLMIIWVRTDMIHVNPMLNLIGYRLYEVTHDQGHESALISKRSRLLDGTRLSVVKLAEGILMEKEG